MKQPILAAACTALGLFVWVANASPLPLQTLAKREGISSCWKHWMVIDDVSIAGGGDNRKGYNTAVDEFCEQADGQSVGPDGYLSLATEVFLNGGKDPEVYGLLGYVYFTYPSSPEYVAHSRAEERCKEYLKKLSEEGGQCYGPGNKDTKGGTWQVGDNAVSYHALGSKVPPREDALNKLYANGAISEQQVNKGAGAPLDPWPLDSLGGVRPVACHSHNDYERDVPLFSALAAGCVAVEVDVHLVDDDVEIGHDRPDTGRTLRKQYVEPLRAILDHNNGGSSYGSAGVFGAKPDQGLALMVDFKTSDAKTLDAVVAALEPLREAGYLSSVEGGRFVERQVTVVASGSAPFDRIAAGDGIPNRDVFYDADVNDLGGRDYTDTNSYYASGNYEDLSREPSLDETIRKQVAEAHAIGLKVRYYSLPSESEWEKLMELGVDMLNADDMSNTARLPRIQ
ncbi:hypothetical protein DL770_002331 [Monosporascus sp. CRB-9-2]|nr:hypothetical protein DL770_002331 [Monosporascus sp. CRB-9-2]